MVDPWNDTYSMLPWGTQRRKGQAATPASDYKVTQDGKNILLLISFSSGSGFALMWLPTGQAGWLNLPNIRHWMLLPSWIDIQLGRRWIYDRKFS